MNFLFVINELSGSKSKKKTKQLFLEKLQNNILQDNYFKQGDVYYISIINPFFNNQEIVDLIIERNISHLTLGGGDGTFQTILSFIYDQQPALLQKLKLVFLPFGSGNGLARHLKMPNSVVACINLLKRNKAKKIDVLLVNKTTICLHNISTGFDAEIVSLFNKSKSRGVWLYAKLTIKNIFKIKKYTYKISCPAKDFCIDAALVVISNTNEYGSRIKIAPMALLDDGLLDIVILPFQPLHNLAFNFLSFLFKPKINLDNSQQNMIYFKTTHVTVTNTEQAPIQISGDVFNTSDEAFTCEVLPQFITCLE